MPLDQPEPLTLEQRAVLLKNFDAGTSEEDKWRGYYHVLFPNDPGYKSISPCKFLPYPIPNQISPRGDFNWQLLPRRMSKVAAVDHDAETSPKSPDQASQTPESLSIETVPFETGTTATTITTTEQDTATTKPYISTELSTTYYWDPQPDSWDPQLDTTGEPLKNDDAETVDPGLLDPDYTITGVYARYDQSETTLFGPDGVNLFSNPTKHPQRVGEAKIVDDFDQGLTSFEFDL